MHLTTRLRRGWALAGLVALIVLVPFGTHRATAESPSDATYAARTKLLGPGWDNPDVVRIKWVAVTTWLASFGGHVVLLELDGDGLSRVG